MPQGMEVRTSAAAVHLRHATIAVHSSQQCRSCTQSSWHVLVQCYLLAPYNCIVQSSTKQEADGYAAR